MRIKFIICFLAIACLFTSCNNDEEGAQSAVLSQVIEFYSGLEADEVIACAASKENDPTTTYVYYYPIPGATNVQYFETNSTGVITDNYANYYEIQLPEEDVFSGYMKRFVRTGDTEAYGIVTYLSEGKFHMSNPIRLKNKIRPTSYSDEVIIDQSQSLMPSFSWNDIHTDNAIYFQVISDANNDFISGTYTIEREFQYYQLDNVVLNINREVPSDLSLNQLYNFSMLAVSQDNWVNYIIEKSFTAE